MIIQSIVYVILTVLSATAVFASSVPVVKEQREEQQAPQPENEASEIVS